MHEPVKENLEDYLSENGDSGKLNDHLAVCEECREEVRQMRDQAGLLRELRPPSDLEPRPGFYARVMEQIEAQRAKASFWSGFLEPVFARRLVMASLTLVILLGTVVAVTQGDRTADVAEDHPEVFMVNRAQTANFDDNEQGRDAVLVNLSTYSEPVSGGIQ